MKLTDAVKGYLLSCKSKCSEKTMRWYRQKLAYMCMVFDQDYEVTLLSQVTVTHLRLFVDLVRNTKADENNPHKPAKEVLVTDVTVKGYVQVLKSFFSWCVREELISKNPAHNLENPKVGRYVIKTFSPEQINMMLTSCNTDTAIGFRDYVIILLLLDTGIRVAELCGLTLDTVFLSIADQAFIKVMGKGRKQREVGLSFEVAQLLWKYIHVYRRPKNEDNKVVFLSRSGETLTINGVQQLLQEIGKRTDVKGVRVSPHTFRHTFARMFLENGGDVYKLSVLLGHSSVVVTENYLKDFESRSARRVQSKHSPIAGLNLGKPKGGYRKKASDYLEE